MNVRIKNRIKESKNRISQMLSITRKIDAYIYIDHGSPKVEQVRNRYPFMIEN